eukprot:g5996.t1
MFKQRWSFWTLDNTNTLLFNRRVILNDNQGDEEEEEEDSLESTVLIFVLGLFGLFLLLSFLVYLLHRLGKPKSTTRCSEGP